MAKARSATRRAKRSTAATPSRRLATSEARKQFSKLVNELAERSAPGDSLLEGAIEIGPHRKGGAWLVPEVDAQAAVQKIEVLEDELENIALGFLLEERLGSSSGATTPAVEVIRELGFDDLLEGLPE